LKSITTTRRCCWTYTSKNVGRCSRWARKAVEYDATAYNAEHNGQVLVKKPTERRCPVSLLGTFVFLSFHPTPQIRRSEWRKQTGRSQRAPSLPRGGTCHSSVSRKRSTLNKINQLVKETRCSGAFKVLCCRAPRNTQSKVQSYKLFSIDSFSFIDDYYRAKRYWKNLVL